MPEDDRCELVASFCSKAWTTFEVEHDGTVSPCCMSKVSCGNVNQNSIQEIWNGPDFQDFRRKMAAGQWEDICGADCPWLRTGLDESVSNPLTPEFAANYALNQAEIARRALVLESSPRVWKTTDSTRCNLDCVMCYQDRDDLRRLPDDFYQALDSFRPFIQELQIIGGEPFAIKRQRELMRRFPADEYPDAWFSLVSNGTIFDDKTLDLVRSLRVRWMSVSLDAATEETYARIRLGGDFQTTLRGTRRWIALGRECGFPVHLAFAVMQENVGEIEQFVRFAHELGADALFRKVFGPRSESRLPDPELLESSIARAVATIESLGAGMPLARLTLESIC